MSETGSEGVQCWVGWKRVLRCINGQLHAASSWALLNMTVEQCRLGMWHKERIKTVNSTFMYLYVEHERI